MNPVPLFLIIVTMPLLLGGVERRLKLKLLKTTRTCQVMSEWWDPAEVKEKRNRYLSRKDKASVSLGGCSIISILLALSITSSFIPNFNASGSGWGLVFIFFIVPLMIFSFAMSLLGICLNDGTRAGKRLCIIAFVLTFSPILMIKIIGWMLEK